MNTVIKEDVKIQATSYQLSNLCGTNFRKSRTAFIGKMRGYHTGLYLIHFEGIIKAEEPNQTWELTGATVLVDRFVDVNISIVEREY